MLNIGIIREGKVPSDSRVAFSPAQCRWMMNHFPNIKIFVQPSPSRCFKDREYEQHGIELKEDMTACDVLFGIKEVPSYQLIPEKTYLFFSHTRKKQPYNQQLFREIIDRNITLIDYECFQYENKQRILGFGYLETQSKIQVHFLMLVATGILFSAGVAVFLWDFFFIAPRQGLVQSASSVRSTAA